MEDSNINKIAKFVETVQEDYEKLSEEQKREFLISFTEVANFGVTIDDIEYVRAIQSEWVKFFNWIMNVESPFFSIDFHVKVAATIDRSAVFSFREDIDIQEYGPKAKTWLCDRKIDKNFVSSWWEDPSKLKKTDFPQVQIEKIDVPPGAFKFFRLLSGISVDVLLKCPTCGKIFVNTTKRKMIYHSPNCRALANVKKFRAKKRD